MLAIDHSSVYISHYDSAAPIRNADDAFSNNGVFAIIAHNNFERRFSRTARVSADSLRRTVRIFTRLDGSRHVEDSSSLNSSESTA